MHFNKLVFFLVVFILVSTSLLSASMAGRPGCQSGKKLANDVVSTSHEEISSDDGESSSTQREMETTMIHERVLRMNTKDYGRYDPSPPLVKPPFKLIPN